MSEAIERVKRYCDIAGMEPSDPLRLALMTTCESAQSIVQAAEAAAEKIERAGPNLVHEVAAAFGPLAPSMRLV